MQAEPSYVTGLVRRIIRLLSGMIVGVLLLLIFERITVIDALFLIVMSVLFSAYLTRNEGRALAQLKNYFRAKAGADNPADFKPSREQRLRATEFDDTELTELIWTGFNHAGRKSTQPCGPASGILLYTGQRYWRGD